MSQIHNDVDFTDDDEDSSSILSDTRVRSRSRSPLNGSTLNTSSSSSSLLPSSKNLSSQQVRSKIDSLIENLSINHHPVDEIESQQAFLDLDKLHRWIFAFAIVDFDLKMGQFVSYTYPSFQVGEMDLKSIAFTALPDSHSANMGDQTFQFRTSITYKNFETSSRENVKKEISEVEKKNKDFLLGYVYFRIRKDNTLERGFFQQSLVLLTSKPWHGLYSKLIKIIGPLYFEMGKPILEESCFNIAKW